jgi:hypothetical protein
MFENGRVATMWLVAHWDGAMDGSEPLRLMLRTSPLGAWEVELAERGGGRSVKRWFHSEVDARAHLAQVQSVGDWQLVSDTGRRLQDRGD